MRIITSSVYCKPMFGPNKIMGNGKTCTHKNCADFPVGTVLYADEQVLLAEEEEHL